MAPARCEVAGLRRVETGARCRAKCACAKLRRLEAAIAWGARFRNYLQYNLPNIPRFFALDASTSLCRAGITAMQLLAIACQGALCCPIIEVFRDEEIALFVNAAGN